MVQVLLFIFHFKMKLKAGKKFDFQIFENLFVENVKNLEVVLMQE